MANGGRKSAMKLAHCFPATPQLHSLSCRFALPMLRTLVVIAITCRAFYCGSPVKVVLLRRLHLGPAYEVGYPVRWVYGWLRLGLRSNILKPAPTGTALPSRLETCPVAGARLARAASRTRSDTRAAMHHRPGCSEPEVRVQGHFDCGCRSSVPTRTCAWLSDSMLASTSG